MSKPPKRWTTRCKLAIQPKNNLTSFPRTMAETITPSQLLGEIGETAVRLRFLNMNFQSDGRSRLEAGVDGIAEVMDNGKPLARMIAVQVKATESGTSAN